jgi:hypothetical protein
MSLRKLCVFLFVNCIFIFQIANIFVASYAMKYSEIVFVIRKFLAYTPPTIHASYGPECTNRDAGTGGAGGASRPRCPLPGGARGAKVPFQFKGLPWRNSELPEMLVQFFYEFASENARNAVIELQE